MKPDDAERETVRFGLGSYLVALILLGLFAYEVAVMPFYVLVVPAALWVGFLGWMVMRRATSITFEPGGVEVGLLFRNRHLRTAVTEFDGSRFRGVMVRDLHTGKGYSVPATRRLIAAAERHGYAVIRRPKVAYR